MISYLDSTAVSAGLLNHELTDADLRDVREKTWDARNKWFDIGIELGLRHADLTAIRRQHGDDPNACFTEMLALWLNTKRASWADLIAALKHPVVGFGSLADTLESILRRETLDRDEVTAAIEPAAATKQLTIVSSKLDELQLKLTELEKQQSTIEGEIQQKIDQLRFLLEKRKDNLVQQLRQMMQQKRKNLSKQRDNLVLVKTELDDYLSHKKESLRTGSLREIKPIPGEMTNFNVDQMPPCEPANFKFAALPELEQACQQFGEVYVEKLSPEKCYATGKGLEIAVPGEKASVVLHTVDHKGIAYSAQVTTLDCLLVSTITNEGVKCVTEKTNTSCYGISYQAGTQGIHRLHIKVEDEHVKGSPFLVTVKLPIKKLGTLDPIRIITGVKAPWGIAINQNGDIIIAEDSALSVFTCTGEKCLSIGSSRLHPNDSKPEDRSKQLDRARGVAVDSDGNILVMEKAKDRIVKFTSDGDYVAEVGKRGNQELEFNWPKGIAIHPKSKRIYVADDRNHRIQILNPDLTFHSKFGSKGSGNGQFNHPWDIAFDSTGNAYVADKDNHHIQVFTEEGRYVRQFGKEGSGDGELNAPSSVAIGNDDVLYVTEYGNHRVSVFTFEGEFLTSFGKQGNEPRQFYNPRGITVDKSGVVYISDSDNDSVKLF